MIISPLVSDYIPSPYCSERTATIDTITVHCMAGEYTAKKCGEIFQRKGKDASANYGIGPFGDMACYVPEEYRAWTSSNRANDMRAINIEVASSNIAPYTIRPAARAALVDLLVDIVKRYDSIPMLRWTGNKTDIGNIDVQNMTVHRWFANKACPGDYLMGELPIIAREVNERLLSSDNNPSLYRVQVGAFANYDNALNLKAKLQSEGYECWIVKKES